MKVPLWKEYLVKQDGGAQGESQLGVLLFSIPKRKEGLESHLVIEMGNSERINNENEHMHE